MAKLPLKSLIKNEAIKFMRSQVVAAIGTVDPNGRPQVATIFFWINDLSTGFFNAYVVTRRHTRKFENLLSNKNVALVIGTDFAPSSVQIDGTAEIIELGDGTEEMKELQKRLKSQPTAARLLGGAFLPRNPFTQIEGKDFALIRIKPLSVRYMKHNKATKKIEYHAIANA